MDFLTTPFGAMFHVLLFDEYRRLQPFLRLMLLDSSWDLKAPLMPGRLLGVSRAWVLLLLALAVVNGAFLFGVPARADTDCAWVVTPPISAASMGAGYLAAPWRRCVAPSRARS